MSSRLSSQSLWTISLALLIISLMFGTFQPVQAATPQPYFKPTRCRFTPPNLDTDCGDLYVPANRANPQSTAMIKLHVGIIHSDNRSASLDPIIFLDGGPGGRTLENIELLFDYYFSRVTGRRDLIVFDQRGVGLSEPALDCKELDDKDTRLMGTDASVEEQQSAENKALIACRDRLLKAGVDLSAYNTAENAADLHDLMMLLGYQEYNLYGISYGTRLALTTMRDFPERIRSVVLDSSVPLQAPLFVDIPHSADRAFHTLFEGCLNNRACNRSYPQLEKVFYETIARLTKDPVTETIMYRGKNYKVVINGSRVVDVFQSLFYSTDSIPHIPAFIYEVSKGDYERMAYFISGNFLGQSAVSVGMYFAVQCSEEVRFNTETELQQADQDLTKYQGALNMGPYFTACQEWGGERANTIENEAVRSSIPTLVLAGEYDPITPPAYGQLVSETLDHSYFYTFPGLGHGVSIVNQCPRSIMLMFLRNPDQKPNGACVQRMEGPRFH